MRNVWLQTWRRNIKHHKISSALARAARRRACHFALNGCRCAAGKRTGAAAAEPRSAAAAAPAGAARARLSPITPTLPAPPHISRTAARRWRWQARLTNGGRLSRRGGPDRLARGPPHRLRASTLACSSHRLAWADRASRAAAKPKPPALRVPTRLPAIHLWRKWPRRWTSAWICDMLLLGIAHYGVLVGIFPYYAATCMAVPVERRASNDLGRASGAIEGRRQYGENGISA